jgi:glycosyltransferase involved in cell wall biosynthesis
MSPKVSVAIPFFNEEKYIEDSMKTVLDQTFTDFEIIMVNDGSTDGSMEIVKKYAARDNRIRLIGMKRSGLAAALNAGIEAASGEYIARMDADDIMHRERLGLQYEYMSANPDVSVLSSLVTAFPENMVSPNMQYYINWLNSITTDYTIKRDIFIESPVPHPTVMLKRDELIGLGGYCDNGMPEDYDLWLRYYAAGKKFHKIDKVLHFWCEREDRHSRTSGIYSKENFVRLKAGYLAESVLSDKENIYIWGAGRDGKCLFRHLNTRNIDLVGFVDIDPKKISQKICGLPVISYNKIKGIKGFIVVCVGSKGARHLIREKLDEFGYVETKDYICTA